MIRTFSVTLIRDGYTKQLYKMEKKSFLFKGKNDIFEDGNIL